MGELTAAWKAANGPMLSERSRRRQQDDEGSIPVEAPDFQRGARGQTPRRWAHSGEHAPAAGPSRGGRLTWGLTRRDAHPLADGQLAGVVDGDGAAAARGASSDPGPERPFLAVVAAGGSVPLGRAHAELELCTQHAVHPVTATKHKAAEDSRAPLLCWWALGRPAPSPHPRLQALRRGLGRAAGVRLHATAAARTCMSSMLGPNDQRLFRPWRDFPYSCSKLLLKYSVVASLPAPARTIGLRTVMLRDKRYLAREGGAGVSNSARSVRPAWSPGVRCLLVVMLTPSS